MIIIPKCILVKYTNCTKSRSVFCRDSIFTGTLNKYIIVPSRAKGVVNSGYKKKRRRAKKPTAQPSKMEILAENILAGIISGLITALILKLLDW